MTVESSAEQIWSEALSAPWAPEAAPGTPGGSAPGSMAESDVPMQPGGGWGGYIAPSSSYIEADASRGEAEPWLEQQSASLVAPAVTTSFPAEALAELPDVLGARPLAQLSATVQTERVLWMILNARATAGTEPGWADRLLVDLTDLPKAAPKTAVHIAVVQTVPFEVNETDKLVALHRFAEKVNPTPEPRFDVLTVGHYPANRALDEQFGWPPASIATAARLSTVMTVEDAANYKLVVFAVLPQTVGAVVAPRDHRSLRGFPFDKAALTPDHENVLNSLAREVARSWHSRRQVTRIVIQGHTDPVGTRDYNYGLGRRRADAVAARLKQLVNEAARTLPAGTVERIVYIVDSYGEDRPFSRLVQALNRRVEITLYREVTPSPTPLDLDSTMSRLDGLLKLPTSLAADIVTRLRCLLQKVREPGTDDRFANETQVFLIKRDNVMPQPTEWSRVRHLVLHPDLFGPQLSDVQVVANLGRIDEDIIEGVAKMNQIIAYASGAEWGLGLLALPNAFKQFNAWLLERLKDPASVYYCYPDLRP
jgi:outer membrane protein OmpA-like peptidoglycan-associated protein